MPALALTILQALHAAILAAPQVKSLVENGKALFASLFEAGLISKDQQDKLHSRVDEICRAALAGEVPPHWQVEPDPVSAK